MRLSNALLSPPLSLLVKRINSLFTEPLEGFKLNHHLRISTWNTALSAAVSSFSDENTDATVLLFSAWKIFCEIFYEPENFGFKKGDSAKAFGKIWVDQVHPTTKMHGHIAVAIKEFLQSVERMQDLTKSGNSSSESAVA